MNESPPAPGLRPDARRAVRQRAFLRAKISYLDGALSLDCIVTQISDTGARVDLKQGVALPQKFRIVIPQRQIDRTARLVRREPDWVAIAFVDDAVAAEADLETLRERLRVAEAENKMLRATCDALNAQLERLQASY